MVIFDDRLDYDPSNVIMVIITQATIEGSNYPEIRSKYYFIFKVWFIQSTKCTIFLPVLKVCRFFMH